MVFSTLAAHNFRGRTIHCEYIITLSIALSIVDSQDFSILTRVASFALGILGFFHLSKLVNSESDDEVFAVKLGCDDINLEEIAALLWLSNKPVGISNRKSLLTLSWPWSPFPSFFSSDPASGISSSLSSLFTNQLFVSPFSIAIIFL